MPAHPVQAVHQVQAHGQQRPTSGRVATGALHRPGTLPARRVAWCSPQRHLLIDSRHLRHAHQLVGAILDGHEANLVRTCLLEHGNMMTKATTTKTRPPLLLLHSCCEADSLGPIPHGQQHKHQPQGEQADIYTYMSCGVGEQPDGCCCHARACCGLCAWACLSNSLVARRVAQQLAILRLGSRRILATLLL